MVTNKIMPSKKKKEINQGNIKQGNICGQSVTSQLLLLVFTVVLQLWCNSSTMNVTIMQ